MSTLFDSPASHGHIFSGFGAHQSTTDSSGTLRRHTTSNRLLTANNPKRIYDEVNSSKQPLFLSCLYMTTFLGVDDQKGEDLLEQRRYRRGRGSPSGNRQPVRTWSVILLRRLTSVSFSLRASARPTCLFSRWKERLCAAADAQSIARRRRRRRRAGDMRRPRS